MKMEITKEPAKKEISVIEAVLITHRENHVYYVKVTRVSKNWIFYKLAGNEYFEGKINRISGKSPKTDSIWNPGPEMEYLDRCIINSMVNTKYNGKWDGGWRPNR